MKLLYNIWNRNKKTPYFFWAKLGESPPISETMSKIRTKSKLKPSLNPFHMQSRKKRDAAVQLNVTVRPYAFPPMPFSFIRDDDDNPFKYAVVIDHPPWTSSVAGIAIIQQHLPLASCDLWLQLPSTSRTPSNVVLFLAHSFPTCSVPSHFTKPSLEYAPTETNTSGY